MTDFTEAELNYFNSRGDVNDALARENNYTPSAPEPSPQPAGGPLGGPLAPPAEPVAPVAPPAAAAPSAPATPPAAPATDEDPGDEIIPGQPNPTRVRWNTFRAEQEARQAAERQLQERIVAQARIEERLNLLQQALAEPEQPQTAAQKRERPDPNQDIFAYTQWLEDQLTEVTGKVTNYEQQIQVGQAEMDEERRYFNSLNSYAGREPNFLNAYNFLLRNRAAELMASRWPQATYEQLMNADIPDDIGDILRQEERDLYKNSFTGQRNPAADIFRMAQMRGWRAPAAPAANGTAAPAANGAAAPAAAARPTNGAAAPVQQAPAAAAAPANATELVEQIKRGQPAAQSLSNGSGSALSQLTPETLGNMSQDDFAAIFNELQNSGNKARLRELMGA